MHAASLGSRGDLPVHIGRVLPVAFRHKNVWKRDITRNDGLEIYNVKPGAKALSLKYFI
jgi:hypothetical protein